MLNFFFSFLTVIATLADYVYFETSSTSPYQIRRIEELNKTPSGNVEAKVMCFYRRRDLPTPLVQLADKHQSEYPHEFINSQLSPVFLHPVESNLNGESISPIG